MDFFVWLKGVGYGDELYFLFEMLYDGLLEEKFKNVDFGVVDKLLKDVIYYWIKIYIFKFFF